ncbi:hypothetical protein L6164_024770 [Bauhinia variegata]|uniref:Uncharacterized protein n=1 Tax=Bauhinia variegata TaxID=167791 RepID=A0ACB9LZD8_BAUVA|nr:hypothetical protein L6164_024770 [Bauhinia variegata]
MSERTLIPIFIFWLLLTFITPTLIHLSENSKADFNLNGNKTEGMRARRMMGYTDNHAMITPPNMALVEEAEEPVPAPAPGPPLSIPSLGTGRATLTRSCQNHTLRSNSTDDGTHQPN